MALPDDLPVKSKMAGPMQVSKWLSCPMLIDEIEMSHLMQFIAPFEIFITSGILSKDEGWISKDEFLNCYTEYVSSLRSGQVPNDNRIQKYFSAVFTRSNQALYSVVIDENRHMIKVDQPVVQLQMHRIALGADNKFRSMVLGQNSIFWGIQFAFPQLYQDANMQVITIREHEDFPNSALFVSIQKWMRVHTVPTPFLVDEMKVNVPFRLGKACFEWINNHPQLKATNVRVVV